MTIVIGLLGLIAGVVTTLAGAGGGVFLIAALSLVLGPHLALATSAPTLLAGNVHRLGLYRKHVQLGVALPVVAGAVPGGLIAGALAMSLPQTVLQLVFLTITGYSVARAFGAPAWKPRRALLVPAGAVVGGISATSGGAGLLLSPLLLSSGLTGERYIATSAAVALSTHAARLTAYFSRGVVTREVLGYAGVATLTIVIGNLLGDRIRPYVAAPNRASFVEHGTLAVCTALAVAGLR